MKYIITLILFFIALISQGQAPDLYKLVYDSMELTTGGPSVTKSTTLKKDQDYKVILLEVPKGHNGYDVVISFKEKVIVPTEVFIDNNPNETINSQLVNTYAPGSAWTPTSVTGHYNNTISYSNIANSTLVTKFTGTKIVWIAEKDKHLGKIGVSIDNGLETVVDQYNATNLKQQSLFTRDGLTRGLHTIKLRVTGEKNAASSNTFCVHDAFKVTP